MSGFVFWLGIVAACCTTLASLPQVRRSLVVDSTQDLHVWTLFTRAFGCVLWAIYGGLQNEYILFTSAAIAAGIECLLILAKCRDLIRQKADADAARSPSIDIGTFPVRARPPPNETSTPCCSR